MLLLIFLYPYKLFLLFYSARPEEGNIESLSQSRTALFLPLRLFLLLLFFFLLKNKTSTLK